MTQSNHSLFYIALTKQIDADLLPFGSSSKTQIQMLLDVEKFQIRCYQIRKSNLLKALSGCLNAWQAVQIGSLFEHLPHPNILYFRFLAVDSFCFLA